FHPVTDLAQSQQLKRSVLDAFAAVIPPSATVQHNLHELMAAQMGLGPITDIIAYTLPLGLEAKLALLAEANVGERARLLVQVLRERQHAAGAISPASGGAFIGAASQNPAAGGFPPPFSRN